MRLWSLDPAILDRAALVACWRETLLAQKVLNGGTRGYTRHPQLVRFRAHPVPLSAVGAYLTGLRREATSRGYRFDTTLVLHPCEPEDAEGMTVKQGQLEHELAHLRAKVERRAPDWLPRLPIPVEDAGGTAGNSTDTCEPALRPHPLFTVVPGGIEPWEVRSAPPSEQAPDGPGR
ncbi:pyrimidine dimer DNA glycosylase/endonuclease V [Brevibacterium album]|uniref:pyrimidine dimer DNA glycosylase/endonuclease V n=1 Tax=Brevibacterium album TaxID=417948 RepID=UPI0003F97EE4|nr:pyrimidine dimer DNA glycosylase/endonuclease V [Brevibacterium album]